MDYSQLRFQSDLDFFRDQAEHFANAADDEDDAEDGELEDAVELDAGDDEQPPAIAPGTGVLSISIDSRHQFGVNPGDWSFQFTPPQKNVRSIEIQSVELPNTWHTISAVRGNNAIAVVQSGQRSVLTVADGTWAIDDLLTALNAAAANGLAFSLVGGRVVATQVGGTLELDLGGGAFATRPAEWGLGWVLGFRTQQLSGQLVYAATAPPSLRNDAYVFLEFGDWDGILRTDLQTKAMAKLPTNGVGKGLTIFADGRDMVTKSVVFPTPRALRKLAIRFVDAWGQPLDLNDQHVSLTLAMTVVGGGGLQ